MADETTAEKASTAVDSALENGQSQTIGDISSSATPARDAYSILQSERDKAAQKNGRRPLFRGILISTMGAQ